MARFPLFPRLILTSCALFTVACEELPDFEPLPHGPDLLIPRCQPNILPYVSEATGGLPQFTWTHVPGAVAYEIHLNDVLWADIPISEASRPGSRLTFDPVASIYSFSPSQETHPELETIEAGSRLSYRVDAVGTLMRFPSVICTFVTEDLNGPEFPTIWINGDPPGRPATSVNTDFTISGIMTDLSGVRSLFVNIDGLPRIDVDLGGQVGASSAEFGPISIPADPLDIGPQTITLGGTDQTGRFGAAEFTVVIFTEIPKPLFPDGPVCDPEPRFGFSESLRSASYTLQIASDSTFSAPIIDEIVTSSPAALSDFSMLMPGESYFWRVRGNRFTNISYNSPWSDARSFTWEPGTVELSLTAPFDDQLVNTWTPEFQWTPVTGATYRLLVAPTSRFDEPLVDLDSLTGASVTSAVPLNEFDRVYWMAQAVLPDGCVLSAGPSPVQINRCIDMSLMLDSPVDGATDIEAIPTFSWTGMAAESYDLEIATDPLFQQMVPGYPQSTSTESFVSVTQLGPAGQNFFWRVRATRDDGCEVLSPFRNFSVQ